MKRIHLCSLSIFLLTLCALAHAAGALRGTITAGTNATPVANAHVVLRGASHEFVIITNSDGAYEFPSLDPAVTYSISVEAEGFRPVTKTDISISDGQPAQLNFTLQLADVHTTVLVDGGIINLEAATAEVSQTIDSNEVDELPVANRTAAKYALLDPHVRQTLGLGADYQDSMRLSINDGSYRHTSYMLDGTSNYDWVYAVTPQAVVAPASVDAVRVITGVSSAQYGGSTNGIIAITTPSGTDTFHGDFFAYIRPSGIQARPELAPFHVPNQRLDWGANLGGPIVKGKTFFFASYERLQQDRGAILTVPAPGFFEGRTNEYSGLLRLDHNLTTKNLLTARFNGDHYATNNSNDRVVNGNQPSYGRAARVQSWGGQIADQAVIGSMVNVARFTYTNYFPDSATPLDPSVGISIDHYNGGSTPQYQSGYSTYNWVHAQNETLGDTLALRQGKNSWQFGGEFVHLHVRDYSFTPYGTYYFHSLTDFDNNSAYKYAQTYGAADVHYGQKQMSAYLQDEIHLLPRLTANLGLRYEFQSITDSHHNLGPRVGLAWDASGDGKTIVRVGGGLLFDQYYMYLNRRFITLGLNPPQFNYSWDCTLVPNPCPNYPTATTDPNGGAQSRFVSYIYIPADKLLNPYSIQFSGSVERELTRNLAVTFSGLQVHTLQQMRVNDIDHPAPYAREVGDPVRAPSDANTTRPFWNGTTCVYQAVQGACLVDRIENTASSIYQSFDAALKGRFSRWGEFNAHYVFAASYATAMFYADYNSGIPSEWWPNWNRLERSPSDFYQRNRFILDAVLRGPYKTTMALTGDFGSGLPVNPLTGQDDNGDGYTADRPVGFGRNSFRTPAEKTINIALAKQFTLRERLRAEGRIEALNVFNSRNFINVNNNYGESTTPSTSFLTPLAGITNTDPSRQLQFALRFLF